MTSAGTPPPRENLFQQFFQTESAGGALLLLSGVAAMVVANSPWADAYLSLWQTPIAIRAGGHELSLSLHAWINDALMAVFFLLVGLEIKRELVAGELASPRQAGLPIAGALGGMIVPALIYALMTIGSPGIAGWGIPMATDIAFALGTLALVAPGVPTGAKVFLTALAIVDDMGAVIVIALFYTAQVHWEALGAAGAVLLALIALNRLRVGRLTPYLALGVMLWFFVHESGIHATIAGVALAMTIPTEPLLRLEQALHGFAAFVVMPLFALANAGVALGGPAADLTVSMAAGLGLALGKPAGIMLAVWIAVASGLATLPQRVSWRLLHATAWLGGIGFTMSLFIATLAFDSARLLDAAKLGVMAGSLTAGLIGVWLIRGVRSTFTPSTTA